MSPLWDLPDNATAVDDEQLQYDGPPSHIVPLAVGIPSAVAGIWVLATCTCCCLFNFYDEGTRILLLKSARIDAEVQDCLANGDIRLLRCEWLKANRDVFAVSPGGGLRAPRMQDLLASHPEAFLAPEAAAELYASSSDRATDGQVFVVSHAWRTPFHPDPDGSSLDAILKFLAEPIAGGLEESALFWDFLSLPQKGIVPAVPREGAHDADAEPTVVKRTDDEAAAFQRALKVMGNLYGSMWATCVLRLKHVPPRPDGFVGTYNEMPYDQRGWPTFERFAAELAEALRRELHSVTIAQDDLEPKLIDIGGGSAPATVRLDAPPSTEEMLAQLRRVTFTNGKEDQQHCLRMLNGFATALRSEVDASNTLGTGAVREAFETLADQKSQIDSNPRLQRAAATIYAIRIKLLLAFRRIALRVVPPAARFFEELSIRSNMQGLTLAVERFTSSSRRSLESNLRNLSFTFGSGRTVSSQRVHPTGATPTQTPGTPTTPASFGHVSTTSAASGTATGSRSGP